MNKTITDKIYSSIGYIVMAGFLVAYFFFQASTFEKPVLEILKDIRSIAHIIFVTVANVVSVSIAMDKGLEKALENENFKQADQRNNEYIQYFNKHYEKVIEYIDTLNELERKNAEKEYLLSIGKRSVDELDEAEWKGLNKLKPKRYSTKGITLPLYYEQVKGNLHTFDTSYSLSGNKAIRASKKALMGLLFGIMTVDIAFNWQNLGQALTSTLILGAGMLSTYFVNYNAPILTLTKKIPKRVDNKETFYKMVKEYIERGKIVNENSSLE